MHADHPLVFLLEDSFVVGAQIERVILTRVPECRLIWSRSIHEAHVRSIGLPIFLFLLDVELPDGNGLDFLLEMRQTQPSAQAIVISGVEPVQAANARHFGILRFLRKPIESFELAAVVRETLTKLSEETTSFRANLQDLTPMDVLQLKCLSNATTVLEFRSAEGTGAVHIDRGEIVHAEAGNYQGINAICQIIGWKAGAIAEKPPSIGLIPRTIGGGWQSLLMRAAQVLDEGGSQ